MKPNKNNPIAKFTVRDLPNLKTQKDPVTEADMALVKSIWTSNLIRCYQRGLLMDSFWLGKTVKESVKNFAAEYAMLRSSLRKMYKFTDDQRGSSLEQLRWLHTIDKKAGFYPENLTYTLPINIVNPQTQLFDLEPTKDEIVERRSLKGKGKKKAIKGEREVSFSFQFWARKSNLVVPTLQNIPPDAAILISEKTGRRTSLTGLIKEGGGSPYHGLIWLRKNKGATIEEAILKSIEILSEEMKKEGKKDFEEIVKSLMKSFSKIPENTIRAIVIDNWTEEGKEMSLEAIRSNLRQKSKNIKSCVVWDEDGESEYFESTKIAAEVLGLSVPYLHNLIYEGKKTANNYWITRGKEPKDLEPIIEWNNRMKSDAKAMHIFLKDRVSSLEEAVYFAAKKEKDLSLVAKSFKLKRSKVVHIWDKVEDIMITEFSRLNKSESTEKLPMETISADPDTHSEIFRKRSGVGKGDSGFDPYPSKGLPELLVDTTGASNVNRSGKKVTDDKKVTSK